MLFNIVKTALPFSGCLYHRHKPRAKGSLKTKFRKAKVALAVLRLIFLMDLPLRLIAARATYFLCFVKESKQRKTTPTYRFAARTTLTPHPFFGACELAALRASSDKRTLFSEKRMLRSAERRGGATALNICDGLGRLKTVKRLAEFCKPRHRL